MMQRGFAQAEYEGRLARAQALMQAAGIEALLLSCEADIRYFTGFLTRFWESPSRPWFLVVPCAGKPVAVIPTIGAALMAQTWISDIRTWSAPDLHDDGVSLLIRTLNECAPGCLGTPMGYESHLRMPLADWARVQAGMTAQLRDDAGIVADLRAVKSEAEIDKIAQACAIAGRSFGRVPEIARAGVPLSRVFRDFQRLCLEEGADWVPYLAGGAGQGGYGDVISPATDAPLARGDVLMLDTGLVRDGYFSDFDRNYSVGAPDAPTADAQARLLDAVAAGAEIARAGSTAAQVFAAMDAVVQGGAGAGRLGHGLGMQLTEGLSLTAQDHRPLRAGMVLTLEPSVQTAQGRLMVHEEVIVITDGAPRFLSPRAAGGLVVL